MSAELIPIEVEQLVIGQVLFSPEIISRAARVLKPEHLGDRKCRQVYEACLDLWRDDKRVDLMTAYVEMKRRGMIHDGRGAYALSDYMYHVANTTHFDDHVAIVVDYFRRRTLKEASDAVANGLANEHETQDVISRMSEGLEATVIGGGDTDVSGAEVAYDLMNGGEKPKPIYLGVDGIDGYVFLLPGNMVTVKGEAGSGKTAFVLSAILNMLPQRSAWVVSLEMTEGELITRSLCQMAEVDISDALQDRLDARQREKLAKYAVEYAGMLDRMRIEPGGSMSLDEFRAKAEHMVKRRGVGLIVVDYAQLIEADPKRYPNQTQQLEAVSKGIRETCKRLGVPGIVVVHISKDGTEHGTKQFEKDAHVRLAIERETGTDRMTITVLKNRNGRVSGPVTVPCKMCFGTVGRMYPPAWVNRGGAASRELPEEPMF